MSIETYQFNLPITPGAIPPVLHLSQYDSGRTFTAILRDDANVPFELDSGATAVIKGRNAAGIAWQQDCTVSGANVTFTPSGAATDQFGVMPVTIEITESEEVISPLCVVFNIQKAGYTNEEAVLSPDFETAIQAAVAQAIAEGGLGFSDEFKEALLDWCAHTAWDDTDGQDRYDALEAALYPETHLVSITAAYDQDRPIYDADSAETNYAKVALDLTVTAHYSDGTSETVTGYTLSGDFTVGTSTITVTYQGKITSISVSVLALYILTEYIENAGDANSWIELDVVPSNTFGYKANISFAERTSDLFVFGTRETTNGRILMGVNAAKKPYFGWASGSSTSVLMVAVNWGVEFVAKCNYLNDRKTYINTTDVLGSDLPALGFTPTWNWIVLGYKNEQGAISGRQCKIYKEGIEITDGSNVIRDLRPCYRATDNAIGLVDILTNTFYGNSGTGSLAKGADLT